MNNYMKLEIAAIGDNESFARSAIAAFSLPLNPTLLELSDIKTAVSEAVTNCIVHAYKDTDNKEKKIILECEIEKLPDMGILHITVIDYGRGIKDVEKAVQPFYTTLPGDERSGMGFTIMQSFMSDFSLTSNIGEGTKVCMSKKIGVKDGLDV